MSDSVAWPDPEDFDTCAAFKRAVYDQKGIGNWIHDMKIGIIWKETHDKELNPAEKQLLKD